MARYGQAYKDRVVARLLPPESAEVDEVSRAVGLSVTTLLRWRAEAVATASGERPGAGSPRWTAAARDEDPGELLPGVHRIASLAKRWLLGTHQGAVDAANLPSPLNEFVFRFNRRHSRSRRMLFYRVLELAVVHGPVRYRDLVAARHPKALPPTPPKKRGHPPTLDRPAPDRPWRKISNSG